MKYLLLLCVLLVSCNNNNNNSRADNRSDSDSVSSVAPSDQNGNSSSNAPIDSSWIIIPGNRVGHVILGESTEDLKVLGPPDLSDAAMGKAWLTWNGKRDEHNNATVLNVYTSYKDNSMREKTVQQIRTTSMAFHTPESLHVYSSLDDIRQHFPGVKKVAEYTDDDRPISLYDAKEDGIAFEIANASDQQICIGIIIHKKRQAATDIYIMLHPSMKIL
jgi:hypothetical protein